MAKPIRKNSPPPKEISKKPPAATPRVIQTQDEPKELRTVVVPAINQVEEPLTLSLLFVRGFW